MFTLPLASLTETLPAKDGISSGDSRCFGETDAGVLGDHDSNLHEQTTGKENLGR